MINRRIYSIFKKGSRTYFYTSIYFPKDIKEDVFTLYSFFRAADDYVDTIPPLKETFHQFRRDYEKSLDGHKVDDIVIDSFTELMERRKIRAKWVDAFLDTMERDMHQTHYETLDEVLEYTYGAAEVIGLMMARILKIKREMYPKARALGRSMQYINFLRDIDEDNKLGRRYLPMEELREYGLKNLSYEHVSKHPLEFKDFMHTQLNRFKAWQREGESGVLTLPKRYQTPIFCASDMYKWTAFKIASDPFIVYRKKVKPSKARIITNLMSRRMATYQ